MTALKSLLFLILVPGMVAGVIPITFLLTGPYIETSVLVYPAFLFWVIGGCVLLWCFWDFLTKGFGTPAPIAPPKELVVSGMYKYVRNPMYVGVILMLIAYFLWFGFWSLLIYTAAFFLACHLFVLNYEEPTLKKKFGRSYTNYMKSAPRWIPKFK